MSAVQTPWLLRIVRGILVAWWLPLALIVAWAAISQAGWVSRVFLPHPGDVAEVLIEGLAAGELLADTLTTLSRMTIGWLLSSILAVVLAIAIAYNRRVGALLSPVLEMVRPLPPSAFVPLAVLLLGLTNTTIVAVIAVGSMWPLLLNTVSGLASTDERLKEVARTTGLGSLQFLTKIAIPGALPDILAGLRLGLTLALILCIVAEMVVLSGGLGAHILMASRNYRSADLFAGIVLIGALGYAINAVIHAAERRLLRWQDPDQA